MGPRERLIVSVVAAAVVVAAVWILLVSPERSKAAGLSTQIATARSALATTQAELTAEEQARASYPAELHAVKLLEGAVPLSDEEPQLIRLINKLEIGHVIKWSTTSLSGVAATGGLSSIGLSFTFTATYGRLQSFFTAVDALTQTDGTNVRVKGRLFTVNSVTLTPVGGGGATATVNMDVYEMPVSATPTAATPATGATAPTGTTGTTATTAS